MLYSFSCSLLYYAFLLYYVLYYDYSINTYISESVTKMPHKPIPPLIPLISNAYSLREILEMLQLSVVTEMRLLKCVS